MGVSFSKAYSRTWQQVLQIKAQTENAGSQADSADGKRASVIVRTNAQAATMNVVCGLLGLAVLYAAAEPRNKALPAPNAPAPRAGSEGGAIVEFNHAQRQREAAQIIGLFAVLYAFRLESFFMFRGAQETFPPPAERAPRTERTPSSAPPTIEVSSAPAAKARATWPDDRPSPAGREASGLPLFPRGTSGVSADRAPRSSGERDVTEQAEHAIEEAPAVADARAEATDTQVGPAELAEPTIDRGSATPEHSLVAPAYPYEAYQQALEERHDDPTPAPAAPEPTITRHDPQAEADQYAWALALDRQQAEYLQALQQHGYQDEQRAQEAQRRSEHAEPGVG